jgi:hypothetical protein
MLAVAFGAGCLTARLDHKKTLSLTRGFDSFRSDIG